MYIVMLDMSIALMKATDDEQEALDSYKYFHSIHGEYVTLCKLQVMA